MSLFKSKICYSKSKPHCVSTTMIKRINRKEELCLNRLRVDFLLKEHLYNHNFVNVDNPYCNNCNLRLNTSHFLLKCKKPSITQSRNQFLADLGTILNDDELNILNTLTISQKIKFLIYGHKSLTFDKNCKLLLETSRYISRNLNLQ